MKVFLRKGYCNQETETGNNHAFFNDTKALIWGKMPYIVLYFKAF